MGIMDVAVQIRKFVHLALRKKKNIVLVPHKNNEHKETEKSHDIKNNIHVFCLSCCLFSCVAFYPVAYCLLRLDKFLIN